MDAHGLAVAGQGRTKCGSAVSKAQEGFMTTVLLATIFSMAGAVAVRAMQVSARPFEMRENDVTGSATDFLQMRCAPLFKGDQLLLNKQR